MKNWAPRVVANGTTFIWQPVTSTAPQSSVLVSVAFNTFINCLDARDECTISKFVDDMKLGTAADSFEGQDALQRDLDELEQGND